MLILQEETVFFNTVFYEKISLNKKLTRKPIAGHSETFHLFKMYTEIFNTPAKTSHNRYGMFSFPAMGRIFPN